MIPKYLSTMWAAVAVARCNRLRQAMLIGILAGPVVLGLANASGYRAQSPLTIPGPSPSFEVASIKASHSGDLGRRIMFMPGRFNATGITVKFLISLAYGVKEFQITGGPGWIGSQRYDVDAKEEDSQAEETRKLPPEHIRKQNQLMMQSLLEDRLKLKVSQQTKELPVFALVIAKNGPKLQEAKTGDTYPSGIKGPDGVARPGMMRMGPGQLTGQALPIPSLVMLLSQQLGRTVQDQTGLEGKYDISLQWTPDESQDAMFKGPEGGKRATDNAPPPDSSGASIFTALQEQLGLKLESTKGPVEIIVVDHVEPPSEN